MFNLKQSKTKRLVAIHGWSGTVLGLLLYVVIFTGAVAVFEREISIWSQGGTHYSNGLGSKKDRLFRQYARDVDRKYYEEIFITRNRAGNYRFGFQMHELNESTDRVEDKAVVITADGDTGEFLSRWEGFVSTRPAEQGNVLARFYVAIHEKLHLPNPYGLILVGVLGLMMMAASISGILIHKHLIRDMFLPTRGSKRLLSARDLHVLAGTWGIPFAILLAFTGVFFSFATTLGIPILAMVAFGGDQQLMIETIQGSAKILNKSPAPLASLDYIIRDAIGRVDEGIVSFIGIQDYGTMAASVRVNLMATDGHLSGYTFGYEGVTRTFEGVKPLFGLTPSIGSSLIEIIAPLHFGSFAGLASKFVWFGLGLAMAYVTATGMLLWTKRREESRLWQNFHHWIFVTIWGLPVAMLISAYAFLLSLPFNETSWWVPVSFVIASIVFMITCRNAPLPELKIRKLTGFLCLGLPLLRHLTGGTSWSEAILSPGQGIVLSIDIFLLVCGIALVLLAKRRKLESPAAIVAEPAE